MKKLFKGTLILFLVLLLAAAGFVYYAYRKINNINEYADRFVDYESELSEYADSRFEDFIFYDKNDYKFCYKVPLTLLYRTINADSMSEFLGLPEEITIRQIGIEPDTESKKADIYLDIAYKNLIDTCLIVKTEYNLSDDQQRIEMRYDDFFIVDEYVTDKLQDQVKSMKGDLMFTQAFPRFVDYYQMPDFKPEYISDVRFEDGMICAVYDIKAALEKYLSENVDKNDINGKLEAVDLEVRKKGIAH